MTLQAFDPKAIIDFWRAAGPKNWFAAEPAFDAEIRKRFAGIHLAA